MLHGLNTRKMCHDCANRGWVLCIQLHAMLVTIIFDGSIRPFLHSLCAYHIKQWCFLVCFGEVFVLFAIGWRECL